MSTNEKEMAAYNDYPHSASPDNPDAGYTRLFVKNDDLLYKRTSAGVEAPIGLVPDGLSSYGSPPDESLVFLAQSIGTQDFWKLTGDEMRQWLCSVVTSSFSTDSRAMQAFAFDDTTDRTITLANLASGHSIRAYAAQASGGTGHKILLPAGSYWNHTGTDRAALLNTAGDYIDALCFNFGGTFRYLVFPSNGVTFAAS